MKMRYANINFDGYRSEGEINTKTNVNIGDFIEIIAIDKLYKYMGISEDEIVDIDFYELRTYDGDSVILPINFRLMMDYPEWNIEQWSPKIIPVFIGVSLVSVNMTKESILLLKKYEPIGCRDEATYNMLKEKGVNAYLSACISLTLPERKTTGSGKVYIIDVPEKAKDYIPKEIKERAEILQHEFYEDTYKEWGISCKEYTRQRLEQYEKEADLIITSRYHATISALALGIPVINILENYHDKFGVLENLIPIYDMKNIKDINWQPKPVKYDNIKTLLLETAKLHITWKYLEYTEKPFQIIQKQFIENMGKVTECFLNKNKRDDVEQALIFSEDAIEFIKRNWDKKKKKKIAVWGLSKTALNIIEFLNKEYPYVQLVEIYDTYKAGRIVEIFGETYILKVPDRENLDNEYFIFVTSNSASKIAKSLFENIHKTDVYLCKLNFITEI